LPGVFIKVKFATTTLKDRLLKVRITNLYKGLLVRRLIIGLVVRANIEKEPEEKFRKAF